MWQNEAKDAGASIGQNWASKNYWNIEFGQNNGVKFNFSIIFVSPISPHKNVRTFCSVLLDFVRVKKLLKIWFLPHCPILPRSSHTYSYVSSPTLHVLVWLPRPRNYRCYVRYYTWFELSLINGWIKRDILVRRDAARGTLCHRRRRVTVSRVSKKIEKNQERKTRRRTGKASVRKVIFYTWLDRLVWTSLMLPRRIIALSVLVIITFNRRHCRAVREILPRVF